MISRLVVHERGRSTIAATLMVAFMAFAAPVVWDTPIAGADETVFACGDAPYQSSGEMQGFETPGTATINTCGAGANPNGFDALALRQDGVNPENYGQTAGWFAYVPTGLGIVRAQASQVTTQAVSGTGYVAQFEWGGGNTSGTSRIASYVNGISFDTLPLPTAGPGMWSGDFGFVLACVPSQGGGCARQPTFQPAVIVSGIELTVGESPGYGPAFAAGSGLWSQPGWVRGGGWSLGFSSSSVSGICQESATLSSRSLGAVDVSASRNQMVWAQCQAPAFSATGIDTSQAGQGSVPLILNATDGAGVQTSLTKIVNVDNSQPVVSFSFSGPTTVSSAAGTQYVTATGGGSPSGIAKVQCSVDNGPATTHTGATAEVPVSGVGPHVISCVAENNAVDPSGAHGWSSAPATFSMDIGAPTASGVWFGKVIHPLKCRKVEKRVKLAGTWVTVRRHGKLVRVHHRARTKRMKVTKCRERLVKRKVIEFVKVKRHGKTVMVKRTRVKKVPLPPQAVAASTKRVAYGKGTTVSGILATTDRTALGGRTVEVLVAPNNQLGQWSQAAVVTTGADGLWSATLPPGPSRLVEAVYAGDSSTLPSTSNTVTLLVPARIRITITPRQLPWDGVLTLHGHLAGGYVPPDGVAMRVLIGLPHLPHAYLAQSFRTNAAGAFALKFKAFGGGNGVATYPVWLATNSNESDYAYAKNSSRRIKVTFGRRTPMTAKVSHHRKRKRRR